VSKTLKVRIVEVFGSVNARSAGDSGVFLMNCSRGEARRIMRGIESVYWGIRRRKRWHLIMDEKNTECGHVVGE
jgi:hypothetical protein